MFTFRLQSVLNYRQSIEEKKLLEFAEGQKHLAQENDRLSEIRKEKAMLREQLKALEGRDFNPADISLYHAYHEIFKEKEILQLEVVRQANEALQGLHAALLEAVQQRKIMDNLSEKQLHDYQKRTAAIERGSADETAVMRFIRNKK